MVTLSVFFQLKTLYFKNNNQTIEKFSNIIYGICKGYLKESDYLINYKVNNYWNEPVDNAFLYNYNINSAIINSNQVFYNQNDNFNARFNNLNMGNYAFMNNLQYNYMADNSQNPNLNKKL